MPIKASDKIACQIIDSWLGFRSRYSEVPGFQVSIRKEGKLIFSNAYGFANLSKKQKYTKKHIGHIASHSKMFTACLAFNMQDRGLVDINKPAVHYLPQFKKHKDKRLKEITLRDLMTNRSGIFRDGLDSAFWDLAKPFLSREQLEKEILTTDLIYEPNTSTKYSNIGFSLLGLALEAAGGGRYDSLIKEHVLKKLSGVQVLTNYAPSKNISYADGYSQKIYAGQRKVFKHLPTNAMAAATGFCSNTESTTKFLHELLLTDEVVTRHTRKDLISMNWPVKNSKDEFYGLGMQFRIIGNDTYVGHSGGYPGFTSNTLHLAGTGYVFGAIINANDVMPLNAIRSMSETIRMIEETFPASELKDVVISKPLMNKWGGSIYAVGRKKALGFPLNSWLLTEAVITLDIGKNGNYCTDKINGYFSVGEPVKFIRKGKTITAIKFGSSTSYAEEVFLKRNKGF